MKNKLNIAELLRHCPSGMELDCTCADNVVFYKIIEYDQIKCVIGECRDPFILDKYGRLLHIGCPKCVIFPKGKTTWKGFEPPCRFKDGDIVATMSGNWIGITKGGKKNYYMPTYCIIKPSGEFEAYFNRKEKWVFDRFATEEEKQELFKVIKDNGYKWDPEIKTLEKLPKFKKFKDGDILFVKAAYSWILIYKDSENMEDIYKYAAISTHPNHKFIVYDKNPLCCKEDISEIRLASEKEKERLFKTLNDNGYEWDPQTKTLKKLPKFKVGDKIKLKGGDQFGIIAQVSDCFYTINCKNHTHHWSIAKQDDWELVQSKFDITTLKPFDRVLVRTANFAPVWTIAFYDGYNPNIGGCFRPFGVSSGQYFQQCIPYEGNEYLRGTTNECSEYYKNWE